MPDGTAGPLTGIRVLEFPQAVAAPFAGRQLAELGAEVIRLEDPNRLDSIRRFGSGWLGPEVPPEVVRDTRPSLSTLNAGKQSLGVDLTHSEGRALVLRLAERSDALIANLSAGALDRLGLGYEDVRAVRPDIVYCTMPAFGERQGPYRDFKTWGPNLSALSGLDHLTGWPDRAPAGLGSIAYVDFLAGATAAAAVVEAILERDLGGRGRFIDISQHELAVSLLGPELMAEATGRAPDRREPQGIYPARGSDRWVAIEGERPEFDTAAHTASEVAHRLQSRGVPAGMVQDLADLASDPQLESSGFHSFRPHGRFGLDLIEGSGVRVSGSACAFDRAGPCFGEDTETVLEAVLGLDAEEREGLLASGVVVAMKPWPQLSRPYSTWARHLMRS